MATRELHAAPGAAPGDERDHLTREDRANLFRFMVMMRASEERALALYRQGRVPGSFYDGRGQEAISVGSSFVLRPEDRMCILHRDLGAHFVRGVSPANFLVWQDVAWWLVDWRGRADDAQRWIARPKLLQDLRRPAVPVACAHLRELGSQVVVAK